MIDALRIRNFKCFRDERVGLRRLTLLAGINGGGKSTLLQALLLLRQATRNARPPAVAAQASFVRLNQRYGLQLGRAQDVLAANPDEAAIAIVAESSGRDFRYRFAPVEDDSLVLPIAERPTGDEAPAALQKTDFTYLSAERIGPRDVHPMDARPVQGLGVGSRGEFTAQVLHQREREIVREELRHPRTGPEGVTFLGKQVELWMRELVPGIELRVEAFSGANVVALRTKKAGMATDWLRPTNMGFGVSYALPILVAGLLAPSGTLFLVENPEAHLHPAAQARVGTFLAHLASGGVQVVVETHSDHVLNGVRLAVARGVLAHEQIVIQFFRSIAQDEAKAQAIHVTRRGGLAAWPEGFFDQSEKDLADLLRARR